MGLETGIALFKQIYFSYNRRRYLYWLVCRENISVVILTSIALVCLVVKKAA